MLARRLLLMPFAPPNLLNFSEQFDNAYWSKLAATISANAIAAPDGSLTADKLVEDSSGSAHRFISTAVALTVGVTYAGSIYLKAAERNHAYLRVNNSGGDLITGTVRLSDGVVTSTLTGTIKTVDAGNGWWRAIGVGVSAVAGNTTVEVRTGNADVYANYTGDGASGIYAWGAMLNAGSRAGRYRRKPA